MKQVSFIAYSDIIVNKRRLFNRKKVESLILNHQFSKLIN